MVSPISQQISTDSESHKALIILVHGGASSGRSYKDVIAILEREKYRCIAPDLPGHGSASKQGPFTFEAAVETIRKAILDNQLPDRAYRCPVVVVGISLGGQAVLAFLRSSFATLADAAIVSGASINPPDDVVTWEIPHMPTDKAWLDLMMEDVRVAGMENMPDLQSKSLSFTFDIIDSHKIPPVLVMVGENDTAMSKRDLKPLFNKVKAVNDRCETLTLKNAWHNHNIDVPSEFAGVVKDWLSEVVGG